jgi:tetratricopeptide (TPR) repeat protein
MYVHPSLLHPASHVPPSYDEWSNMLFNAGERETAARVLKQGAHHNPRWFGGRLGAAIVLRDLGHLHDAIQLYALSIAPSSLICCNFHRMTSDTTKRLNLSRQTHVLTTASEICTSTPAITPELCRCAPPALLYATLGIIFSHIEFCSYQTAVSLDPNQQDYWNNKGNSERALGDLAAAEQSLRKGLKLPPEQVSLLLNLAQVLQDRGETTEVRLLAERAVKVRCRHAAPRQARLGACLIAPFSTQIAPNQYQAQLQMGSVLYKEDRLRESVEYYKNAVALAPTDRCAFMTKRPFCGCPQPTHSSSAGSVFLIFTDVVLQAVAFVTGQHVGRCLQTGGKRMHLAACMRKLL